jgi:predicted enzyme related to lactoylglutathione lyase
MEQAELAGAPITTMLPVKDMARVRRFYEEQLRLKPLGQKPDIRELESRGVAFADYDLPGLKTVEHVCVLGSEKAAWFQDPEGNILCLHEDLV